MSENEKWKGKLEKARKKARKLRRYINGVPKQYEKWAERNQWLGKKITLMADEMGKLRNDNAALQAHLNNTTTHLRESETRNYALQVTLDDLNQRIFAQRNLFQTMTEECERLAIECQRLKSNAELKKDLDLAKEKYRNHICTFLKAKERREKSLQEATFQRTFSPVRRTLVLSQPFRPSPIALKQERLPRRD